MIEIHEHGLGRVLPSQIHHHAFHTVLPQVEAVHSPVPDKNDVKRLPIKSLKKFVLYFSLSYQGWFSIMRWGGMSKHVREKKNYLLYFQSLVKV